MQFSYCRWDWHLCKCLSHLNFFLPADCLLISLVHFFLLRFVGLGVLFFFLIDLEELLIYDLEKKMATHFSILAWKIPWMEEPGRLQSVGSQRVRHDWATNYLWGKISCMFMTLTTNTFSSLLFILSFVIIVSVMQKILKYICIFFWSGIYQASIFTTSGFVS